MKKILVIQQKMIGDVLASTVVCEHLKAHFPNSEIHYLIDEHTVGVVQGNPYIDSMIIFKKEFRKKKIRFLKFLKFIKKERYSIVIDLLGKIESNLVSWISGAALKISYRKWYSKFIYTHTYFHSLNPPSSLGLAIDNRLLLLGPLIKELKHPNTAPKIYLNKSEISQAHQILKDNNVDMDKPLLMIGALGSGPLKTYPLEYMASILHLVVSRSEVTLLINYIPSQHEKIKALLSCCSKEVQRAVNLKVYGSSLRQFLAILSLCDGYLGNEGGASHMAKALGKPNFSIFAPWISKKAWHTFTDDGYSMAVHLEDYTPEILHFKSKKDRKRQIPDNYKRFKPELFRDELLAFLDHKILLDQ